MAEYIEVDLESVDLSFKLPPIGDYKAAIDSLEVIRNDDRTIKHVKVTLVLLEGPEDGIGMKLNDNQDPNHEMGRKKMKQMALACGVPFDSHKIDIEPFLGQQCGVKIVHKSGKDKETMFANVSKFFPIEPPNVPPAE